MSRRSQIASAPERRPLCRFLFHRRNSAGPCDRVSGVASDRLATGIAQWRVRTAQTKLATICTVAAFGFSGRCEYVDICFLFPLRPRKGVDVDDTFVHQAGILMHGVGGLKPVTAGP